MSGSLRQTLLKGLSNKEFRDAYAKEHIRTGIAYQIRALRDQHGWSQAELGHRAGKPQSVISRLEDPDYGKLSLQTLLELASAFDVALLVRFVAFSELIERTADLSPEALAVSDFAHDDLSPARAMGASLRSQVREIATGGPFPRRVPVPRRDVPRQIISVPPARGARPSFSDSASSEGERPESCRSALAYARSAACS